MFVLNITWITINWTILSAHVVISRKDSDLSHHPIIYERRYSSEGFQECENDFFYLHAKKLKDFAFSLVLKMSVSALGTGPVAKERFHSRNLHLCKFIGTKESDCIRKEFNSHRTGLEHQRGRRFIVLEHQYGGRGSM